jgi:hypothetical protein
MADTQDNRPGEEEDDEEEIDDSVRDSSITIRTHILTECRRTRP